MGEYRHLPIIENLTEKIKLNHIETHSLVKSDAQLSYTSININNESNFAASSV